MTYLTNPDRLSFSIDSYTTLLVKSARRKKNKKQFLVLRILKSTQTKLEVLMAYILTLTVK